MTLRETIADAIRKADLGCETADAESEKTVKELYLSLADAVLRALAEWEPSEAVVNAGEATWHSGGDTKETLKAHLRAMAEEGGES